VRKLKHNRPFQAETPHPEAQDSKRIPVTGRITLFKGTHLQYVRTLNIGALCVLLSSSALYHCKLPKFKVICVLGFFFLLKQQLSSTPRHRIGKAKA
jgi:hypothetical protein